MRVRVPERKTTIDQLTLLNDRYRLTEHIGVGGTADVWRATDEILNREVAVKVLREVSDPVQRARFIEESRTLASFNHPGLVVVLDAGILGDRPYLVMTLADDATLASRIAMGPVAPPVVTSIGSQIALALAYVHERGVVHRDVKPGNVLLCADGRAVLSDFGIARLVGSTVHHTRTGDAIGSPAYLAPEQVAGEDLTPAVDIYSLGLVLLEALTAQRAFQGPPVEAAIARLNVAPAIPVSLGHEWQTLLSRMTDRVPENRPTAAEVAEELGKVEFPVAVTGTDIAEPEPTGPIRLPVPEATSTMAFEVPVPPATRSRWPALAVVLIILALAIAALLVLRPNSNGGGGGGSKAHTPAIPKTVPAKYRPALTRLHEGVNGPAR